MLYFLVRRDLAVRYRQTILGVAWAFLQPLATAVVFSVFFGRLVGVPSDGVPYPVFSYVALVPWTFFASAVSLGVGALVTNPELIRKIYFPRLVMPAAAVLGALVDLAVAADGTVFVLAFDGEIPAVLAVDPATGNRRLISGGAEGRGAGEPLPTALDRATFATFAPAALPAGPPPRPIRRRLSGG